MKLPNAEHAIVDEAKVRDYLLSSEHPIGRFKARVFRAAGYTADAWPRLRSDSLAAARTLEVTRSSDRRFGERFVGRGSLSAPSGRPLPVLMVWLIPLDSDAPRLITVYPTDES